MAGKVGNPNIGEAGRSTRFSATHRPKNPGHIGTSRTMRENVLPPAFWVRFPGRAITWVCLTTSAVTVRTLNRRP